ncbi:hypothetical protein I2483_10475 [Sporosarcina sp. E16_3]|uniref:DUF6054 family protein n=1 Tax=Sporosarcina sp. E16_3 TaxID=2789293 RepID=UPI001A9141F2|nr:DUF6054 family protein [Sporosarcina sp. E16_3]MBO0602089.1 hypothetical protein [Sporosarcina sp. E16_3]
MSVREFTVTISPAAAMNVIETFVVLEKYYMRSSNRASLTVTIDNLEGQTKVHAVASGSSEGMFMRFDWGAGNNFANSVESALGSYIVG